MGVVVSVLDILPFDLPRVSWPSWFSMILVAASEILDLLSEFLSPATLRFTSRSKEPPFFAPLFSKFLPLDLDLLSVVEFLLVSELLDRSLEIVFLLELTICSLFSAVVESLNLEDPLREADLEEPAVSESFNLPRFFDLSDDPVLPLDFDDSLMSDLLWEATAPKVVVTSGTGFCVVSTARGMSTLTLSDSDKRGSGPLRWIELFSLVLITFDLPDLVLFSILSVVDLPLLNETVVVSSSNFLLVYLLEVGICVFRSFME